MIRKADLDCTIRDAVVMNLGDLAQRGRQITLEAEQAAAKILAQAQQERKALIGAAHAEGRAEGLAEGLADGTADGHAEGKAEALEQFTKQFEQLDAGWASALLGFENVRDQLIQDARTDVLQLALRLAEKITKRTIEVDPSVATAQLEEILSMLARPTRLVVAVHPDDRALVAVAAPAMLERFTAATHVDLIEDPSLQPGSCVARAAGGGVFDASIDTQLDRLCNELLPDGESRPDGKPRLAGDAA